MIFSAYWLFPIFLTPTFMVSCPFVNPLFSEERDEAKDLDRKVEMSLRNQRDKWFDWNVPEEDGRVLYDLIIKNRYTKALEIGTSTGRSTIWIARRSGWLACNPLSRNTNRRGVASTSTPAHSKNASLSLEEISVCMNRKAGKI